MSHQDKMKRYYIEMGSAMALYAFMLSGAVALYPAVSNPAMKVTLAICPALPFALALWAMIRHLGRVDEYLRRRLTENVAISAMVTAFWTFTYGFLEGVGFPRISMFWVWGAMGASWLIVGLIQKACRQ